MISARAKKLSPYKPGEQLVGNYIKLNANENPFPPSSKTLSLLTAFFSNQNSNDKINFSRYPDPDVTKLREAIAAMLNKTRGVLCAYTPNATFPLTPPLTAQMVHVGNGSDEVLSMIFYTFCQEAVVTIEPSYSFYPVWSGFYSLAHYTSRTNANGQANIEELLSLSKAHNAPIVLANPNAPTGLQLTLAQIEYLSQNIGSDVALIVDEAYMDFGGESCLALLPKCPNLVVVRTFSKSLCGAGLRLGYAVSSENNIAALRTVKNCVNHFPVSILDECAALAVLSDLDYYCEKAKAIVSERERFEKYLTKVGAKFFPSSTNFVLAQFSLSGKAVYDSLKAQNILVRHFDSADLNAFVRITIGTKEQMERLMGALDKIL